MMAMTRALACLVVFMLVGLGGQAKAVAVTLQAQNCGQPAVQDAIDRARDGDTVVVPSGRCQWTETVHITKGIVLKGAGVDRTTIIDDVRDSTITMTTEDGAFYRITGFTFERGTARKPNLLPRIIYINGDTTQFRIDHNKFDHTEVERQQQQTRAIHIQGNVLGLIDHNHFISSGGLRGAVGVEHPRWGGGNNNYGDGSWADDSHWGTDQFVFIEDNVFDGPPDGHMYATDGFHGARFVFRYNELANANVQTHGTESGGRGRGGRAFEIYHNVATHSPDWAVFYRLRSGTALVHGNTVSGYDNLVALNNNRSTTNYGTWMACDGAFPFDLNDGIVYDSGFHNGLDGALTLTDTTKRWPANVWDEGYSVRNMTRGRGGFVLSNGPIRIRMVRAVSGAKWRFNHGDRYRILRATICMDAPGSGKGDLLSGFDPVPKAWPHQVRDPVYVWNNVHNGGASAATASPYLRDPHIVEGRDYVNGVPKPGYTPYIYPHPLTSGPLVSGAARAARTLTAKAALDTGARRGELLIAGWNQVDTSRSGMPWFLHLPTVVLNVFGIRLDLWDAGVVAEVSRHFRAWSHTRLPGS